MNQRTSAAGTPASANAVQYLVASPGRRQAPLQLRRKPYDPLRRVLPALPRQAPLQQPARRNTPRCGKLHTECTMLVQTVYALEISEQARLQTTALPHLSALQRPASQTEMKARACSGTCAKPRAGPDTLPDRAAASAAAPGLRAALLASAWLARMTSWRVTTAAASWSPGCC